MTLFQITLEPGQSIFGIGLLVFLALSGVALIVVASRKPKS